VHRDIAAAAAAAVGTKRHKADKLPDSMTGIAVYFQNVTPPSLVSKLARHVIAYPCATFRQFTRENNYLHA